MCHISRRTVAGWVSVLALVVGVVTSGCASKAGWERTTRACGEGGPPRLCFEVEPDRPLVLEVGGERLIPGECAEAPEPRSGGVAVTARDGRSGETAKRRVRVVRGRTTTVTVERDLRLTVDGRTSCVQSP